MSDVPPPAQPAAYTPAPVAGKTNTLAIVALILGIVIPLGGVIVGPIALGQIKRTGEGGRGLAIAGIIIGAIAIVIYLLVIILSIVAAAAGVGSSSYSG